ncbi:MAG: RidA family protein [Pseudomonadota bacterium]
MALPLFPTLMLSSALLLAGCASAPPAPPPLAYVAGAAGAPYSKTVQANGMVYVAGQLGRAAADPVTSFELQARQAMDKIAAALGSTGVPMDNVVRCNVYLTDISKLGDFSKIYVTYFKPDRLPVRTSVGVAALPAGGELEVDCMAAR